jgi:hypothetical protein
VCRRIVAEAGATSAPDRASGRLLLVHLSSERLVEPMRQDSSLAEKQ